MFQTFFSSSDSSLEKIELIDYTIPFSKDLEGLGSPYSFGLIGYQFLLIFRQKTRLSVKIL